MSAPQRWRGSTAARNPHPSRGHPHSGRLSRYRSALRAPGHEQPRSNISEDDHRDRRRERAQDVTFDPFGNLVWSVEDRLDGIQPARKP
jgi:hypothetical protein